MEPRALYGLVVLFLAGPYGCGTAQTRPATQQVQVMVPVKALPIPTNCGQVPNHTLPETAQAYRLKSGKYLASVECTPGAYQSSQVFFLLDRSGESSTAVLLRFPVLKADGQGELSLDQTGEVWGVISIDGDKSMLQVLNRFRALGDCGILTEYWIGGAKPVAVEMRLKSECDDREADHPERWRKLDIGKLERAR